MENTLKRPKKGSSMRNSGTPIVWDFARALIKDFTCEDNQRDYSRKLFLQLSYLPCSSEGGGLVGARCQDVSKSSPRQADL